MYLKRLIFFLFILWLGTGKLIAQFPSASPQSGSNLRYKKIPVRADTLLLDTLSIIPGTVTITDISTDRYTINFLDAKLVWIDPPAADSVTVFYRVYNYKLNAVVQRLNYDSVSFKFYTDPKVFDYGFGEQPRGIFDFGNIQYNGSIGRSIGFGNSQDAVVNSDLNMTLSGYLADSIEISAAISDKNIPIQPDGTTQQLNEFDQVYLRFRKKGWQLNLGDIDIRQNKSYFLKFYKRLQGVSFENSSPLSSTVRSNTLISGSVAKGKFTRNVFQGLEGNQGPYRLTGANNEIFFIVLAGTERVFIDGELLQRGEDQDYVINYNTAEVAFTPKRMITKDSRIQVEFEYADRNFLNANFYLSQEFEINSRLKLRLGAFTNSDAKNSSINQVLDRDQKIFLGSIGDSVQKAFYPSAMLDTVFDAGKILYEKIFFNNGTTVDSFYQYSTDPSLARYSLSFITVGQGNGNYVPDLNGANGKVYKYVTPVAGQKQGSFEPVVILVTPKKQQLVTVGMDYAVSKGTTLKTELAMSNYDINTFSKINNGDDKGFAAKFQFSNNKQIFSSAVKKVQLTTAVDYEFVQARFQPLERLRQVEFSRDWGLALQTSRTDEHIISVSARLNDSKNHSFSYQFSSYNRGNIYNGSQQTLLHSGDWNGWQFNNQLAVTNTRSQGNKGVYLRPVIDITKQLPKLGNWRLGGRYALEDNTTKNNAGDTITPVSFYFDNYSLYLKSSDQKKNRYGITFFTRSDKYANGKDWVRGDRSYNISLQTELLASEKHQVVFNTTYRRLKVLDPISRQKEDETILGRVEYSINEWEGLLTGNVLYELGTGQEQKRDFAYLEVPAGQGEFTWIDYDSNGVQSLNEFEVAQFADQKKFIRILTPTNEYIKASYLTFNYSFRINPKAVLNNPNDGGFSKFISRFSYLSTLQINNKSIAGDQPRFNPFALGINDTALITLNTGINNILSFNRTNIKWGLDLINQQINGKALLTYGYESRKKNEWITKSRWMISKSFTFDAALKSGTNILRTPNFGNRNYELGIFSLEPRFGYIRGTRFRVAVSYKLDNRENKPVYGGEKSISNSINFETKYSSLQNNSVSASFTFNNIRFTGATNTAVSYFMLDGLLPGRNLLWSVVFNKKLLNNLDLRIEYEGRKPSTTRTIHRGTAAITALF